MSGGILALFGVCMGAAILDVALPGEGRDGPKAFLQFFASLLVLMLILRPIFSLPEEAQGILDGLVQEDTSAEFEQVWEETLAARGRAELEAGIGALLEAEFELTSATCSVWVTLDGAGALVRVDVRLRGLGLLRDPAPVEERLRELFACETEVR